MNEYADFVADYCMTGMMMPTRGGGGGGGENAAEEEQNQLSLVALLVATLRKSMVACRVDHRDDQNSVLHQMEIGWPTNVQHLTHATFNRFHGFLGLPVEFEVEIPCI
ncbi:putative CRIB domain-containing protein [Helianthus anomalus]